MAVRKICDGIFNVGAIDWDRELFDELIPLPEGTTYNSYLIFGSEKTALIDAVDPEKKEELLRNLKMAGVKKIDYIISNHTEQDHSGSFPFLLELFPEAKIVTNPKCKEFLIHHLDLTEDKFIEVNDSEELSLGDKTLKFLITPWVHWPETMLTYEKEDKILFSCDFLGSHLASNDYFSKDDDKVFQAAKRYFAEIMMPFRNQIRNHLQRISEFEISVVCPSHGPVFGKPKFIIDAYKEWTSDSVKNMVLIPYVSMHGSVKIMVEYLVDKFTEKNIETKLLNLTKTDLGVVAINLVDCATIILGFPTLLVGPHPAAGYAANIINALRPKTKFFGTVSSYGWGSKAVEIINGSLSNLKCDLLQSVEVRGIPKKEDFAKLDILVDEVENKHRSLGIKK